MRKQCAKCPWKTSTDPNEIPNGYCATKHEALSATMAKLGDVLGGDALRMMACHETIEELQAELKTVDARIDAEYWAFTRQARAKPPVLAVPEAYKRRKELLLLLRALGARPDTITTV